MSEVFEVRSPGPDGTTTWARTALHVDGDVTVRVRPELLDDHERLEQHLALVGRRLDSEIRRLQRIDKALYWTRRISEALLGISAAMSTWESIQGQSRRVLIWIVATGVSALLRWLVPRLVIKVGRWLIVRAAKKIELEMAEEEAAEARASAQDPDSA